MALQMTDANFNELLNSGKPLVIDFWAEWCGPCRMLMPELTALNKDYKGKLKIYKINTDEERELSRMFNVKALPTIYFITKDKITYVQGYRTKSELKQIVDNFLLNHQKYQTDATSYGGWCRM